MSIPSCVTELHCIMPIVNIPSVMVHGILSYELAEQLLHHSVAMPEIQEKRDKKNVPNGLMLHQYANLYFHARNPMLYKRAVEAEPLCVLQVSHMVISLPNVVLTDQNAASKYVRFLGASQINQINFEMVYAEDWRHPNDQIAFWRHSSTKCAEVLIPHKVEQQYIQGVYVVSEKIKDKVLEMGFNKAVSINPHLFFK